MKKPIVPLVLLICSLAAGCGAMKSMTFAGENSRPCQDHIQAGVPMTVSAPAASEAADHTAAGEDKSSGSVLEARKLVYRGYFTLVVGDIVDAQNKTRQMAEQMGGYLETMLEKSVVIRVPAGKFNDAVNRLGSIGSVAARQISIQDVTEGYMDLATRLENAKALAARLRALLDSAKDVKESLKVERELARVQLEIDQLEGQLKLLDSQTSYATLEIRYEGIVSYTPPTLRVKLPVSWLGELGLNNLLRFSGRELF